MAQDPKKQKEINAAIEEMNSLLQQAQIRGNAYKLESEAIAELQRSIIEGQIKTVAQIDAAVKATAKLNTESQKVKKTALDSAAAYDEMLDLTYDLTKAQGKNNQELIAAAKKSQEILDSLEQKLEAEVKSGKISKKLAAEKLAEARATNDMAQSLGKLAEADIAKPFHDMQKAGGEAFAELAGAFGDFSGMIKGLEMGGIAGAITLIASVIKAAVKSAKEFTERVGELSRETGTSYTQMEQVTKEAMALGSAMTEVGVSSKDIEATFAALSNEIGATAMVTPQLAADVSKIGVAFGLTNDEAAATQATLMQMGMSGQEALAAQEEIAASAFKAGVDQGKVLKDISKSAATNARFFGGDVKRLKAAAIQAAKLGMELDTMAQVADGLLDFENSISKQFEFQALTGKNINLDKAREMVLNDDIAGAMDEMLSQMGGIDEFNKMNNLEKKLAAEMMGMEVDQLQKALMMKDMEAKFGEEAVSRAQELGLSMEEMNSMSDSELTTKLATLEKERQIKAEQQARADEFQKGLVDNGLVFLDILNAMRPAFQAIAFIIKGISSVVVGIVDSFKFLGQLFTEQREELNAIQIVAGIIAGIAAATLITQQAMLFVTMARTAAENAGKSGLLAGLGVMIGQAFGSLASATGTIFKSFGMIPFGLGIPLAIAAVAGLAALIGNQVAKAKATGDLAMSANGGPIVASPREGTIFQGTANDEVAMGPGVIGSAQSSGTTPTEIKADANQGVDKIVQAIERLRMDMKLQPVPQIMMNGALVGELLRTEDTFRKR